jgi:hypothetical protein
MANLVVADRIRHVATIVLRPLDAFREALARPVNERGPVRPVHLRLSGRVVGAAVQPLNEPGPKPIENLSGDTIYRDFPLGAATYRIELVRDPRRPGDFVYEDIDPAQRDLIWDPAAPGAGLPGLPTHPSRFVVIRLFPAAGYPFPTGSTLLRGGLLWYDGTALEGAVIETAPGVAVLSRSRLGSRGDFVLAVRATAATGTANLQLNLTGVDGASRPAGAAYLASLPAVWAAPWERANMRSVRQAALTGTVQRSDGRLLPNATVTVAGRPGFVKTNDAGRWSYHFPPLTASGTVNITVQHPDYAPVTLNNVAFTADRSAAAPTVVLS